MRYTISQLVDKVNSLNEEDKVLDSSTDARRKSLTERRVRDYQTKKLINEPEKDGRNSYYTDVHLNQLLTLREMQKQGMTDSFMQKIVSDSYVNYVSTVPKNESVEIESRSINSAINYSDINENKITGSSQLQSNLLNTLNNIVLSSPKDLENQTLLGASQAVTTNVMKEIGSQYLTSSSLQKIKTEVKEHYHLNQFMTVVVDKEKRFNHLEKQDLLKKFSELLEKI